MTNLLKGRSRAPLQPLPARSAGLRSGPLNKAFRGWRNTLVVLPKAGFLGYNRVCKQTSEQLVPTERGQATTLSWQRWAELRQTTGYPGALATTVLGKFEG